METVYVPMGETDGLQPGTVRDSRLHKEEHQVAGFHENRQLCRDYTHVYGEAFSRVPDAGERMKAGLYFTSDSMRQPTGM